MSELVELIRRSVIGEHQVVDGPFGPRRVVYADYTASGRALTFVEDFVRDAVLPLYANTHTESSGTGLQTTRFREEARSIIKRCCNAGDDYAVIFAGSGATGAIDRLIGVLNIRLPAELDRQYGLSELIPAQERPVVFVGPFEHHSNELPWRESIADVVVIPEDRDGHIDLEILEKELIAHEGRPLRIGSFSAASNVTGIVSDTRAIAALLHGHGALSFWDFAAAAPYVDIDMAPADDPLAYKDAIFLSPHKFIGGPGTPGVLIARRELFTNSVPDVVGGGTVAYVNPADHVYLSDVEHREEGGTPSIIGAVRAGLVFKLKNSVGADVIEKLESSYIRRAIERWEAHESVEVLGNPEAERLSIVSFVVQDGSQYLHHNFVVAVLNDLFGIQSRGGCSCAGPYGHVLLGIDLDTSHEFQTEITGGCEGIKPGWVRVNFNYFIDEEVFNYIVSAVEMVAEHGWKLLPYYSFDESNGLWRHKQAPVDPSMSLDRLTIGDAGFEHAATDPQPEVDLAAVMAEAATLLESARASRISDQGPSAFSERFEQLRWFLLPTDVAVAG